MRHTKTAACGLLLGALAASGPVSALEAEALQSFMADPNTVVHFASEDVSLDDKQMRMIQGTRGTEGCRFDYRRPAAAARPSTLQIEIGNNPERCQSLVVEGYVPRAVIDGEKPLIAAARATGSGSQASPNVALEDKREGPTAVPEDAEPKEVSRSTLQKLIGYLPF